MKINPFDVIRQHRSELTDIAASVGIDFQSVEQQLHRFPQQIKSKNIALEKTYQGRVIVFADSFTTKNGDEYPKFTFYTNRHGGVSEVWSGYEAEKGERERERAPIAPAARIKKPEVQPNDWREKQITLTASVYKSLDVDTGNHPYLIKKFGNLAAQAAGLTEIKRGSDAYGDYLIIELYRNGSPCGYQKIYAEKIKGKNTDKLYVFGDSGKKGAYHLIPGSTEQVYVCEGFATGLSIALATGAAVAVALDAGNITHVVKSLTTHYELIIAADNDGLNGNAGALAAVDAAYQYKCHAVMPCGEQKRDYNDILVKDGLERLKVELENKIEVGKKRLDYLINRIQYLPPKRQEKGVKAVIASGVGLTPYHGDFEAILTRIGNHYPITEKLRNFADHCLKKQRDEVKKYLCFDSSEFEKVRPDADFIFSTGGVYIDNRPMASGKTEFMREVVEVTRANNYECIYVTHRVSIVNNACDRLDIDSYQDITPLTAGMTNGIGVCINSINKPHLQAFAKRSDVVLIDEVRQVLEHIATGSMKRSEREAVFNTLKNIVENAYLVVASDADIDKKTLQFIQSCRSDIRVIADEVQLNQKTLCYGKYNQVKSQAISAATDGKRVLILCDSRRESDVLSEHLKQSGIEKTLVINSDRRGEAEQQAFLDNPNVDRGYQCVIASPSISSGFSITSPIFDEVFLLSHGTLPPNEIIQQAARYRPAKVVTAGFDDRHFDGVSTDELTQDYRASGSLSKFDHWRIRCKSDVQNSRTLGASGVLIGFEVKGWQIKPLSSHIQEISTKMAKAIVTEAYIEDVQNAPDVDDRTAKKLDSQYQKTYSEVITLERHEAKQTLALPELTEADIVLFDRGGFIPKISNFELMQSKPEACRAIDAKEAEQGLTVTLRTHAEIKHQVFNRMLNAFDDNGVLTQSAAFNFLTWLAENSEKAELAGFRIKTPNPVYAIRSFKLLMEKIGLSASCQKHEKFRIYSLDENSLKTMNAVMARRTAGR